MSNQDKKETDIAAELLKDVHGDNKRLVNSLLRRTEPELPSPMPDGSEKSVKTLLTNMKKQADLDKAGNPGVFDALETPKPGSAKDRELDDDLVAMGITNTKKVSKTSTKSNQKKGDNKKAKKSSKASTSMTAVVQAQSTTAAAPQVEGTRKSARLAGTALAAPGRFTIYEGDDDQDFEVSSPAECPNSPNTEDDEMQDAVGIDSIPTPSDAFYPPARGIIVPSVVYPTSNIRDTPIHGALVHRLRQNSAIHPPTEEQQADAEQRIIETALDRHPPWDVAKKARKAQDVEYEDIHTLFSRMRLAVQRTNSFEATVRQNFALGNCGFVAEIDDEHDDIDVVLTKAYLQRMEEVMAQFLEENPPKGSKEEKAMRAKKNRETRSRRKAEADAREKEALEAELLEIGGRMTRTQKRMLEEVLTDSTPAQQSPQTESDQQAEAQEEAPRYYELSEPLRSMVWSRYRDSLPAPEPSTPPKEAESSMRIVKTPFSRFIGRYMERLRLSSNSGPSASGQVGIERSIENVAPAVSREEALAKPKSEASITNTSDEETLVPKTPRAQLPYTPSLEEMEAMLPQRPTVSPLTPAPASSRRRARRISDSSASDTASGPASKRTKLRVRKAKSPTPLASQQEAVAPSQEIIVLSDDDEESELSDDMSDLTIKTPAKPPGEEVGFKLPKILTQSETIQRIMGRNLGRVTTNASNARPQRSTVLVSSATTQPATSSYDDNADYSSPPSRFTTPTPSNPCGHAQQTGSGVDASPASSSTPGVTIIAPDAGSSQGSDWFGYRQQFQDGEDSDGDSRIYNEDDPTEDEDEGNCDDNEEDYGYEDAYARFDDDALTPGPVQILSDRRTPSETGSVEVRTPRQPKRNKGKERMRDDILVVEDDEGNEIHLDPSNFGNFERERARMGAADTRKIHNVWTLCEEMGVADLMNHGIEDEDELTDLYNQEWPGRRIGLETADGQVWVTLKPRKLHEVRQMMTQLEVDMDARSSGRSSSAEY
ncbi:uncharacterized protein LTHEOB_5932 [Lasiodiplodia theobromae]|uniref:uncharacterized protein n=1 Tax=Lasiodiplodia theobromae TaxID=45133 RepID=UPI0015C3D143|nr:uncharacterized protein LTHEOB_5932 [Lasiodiplodia theobromae]KAF4544923.1 hypothetical protein LTHEOB_5932 [Lasiodiplodia theobromae]